MTALLDRSLWGNLLETGIDPIRNHGCNYCCRPTGTVGYVCAACNTLHANIMEMVDGTRPYTCESITHIPDDHTVYALTHGIEAVHLYLRTCKAANNSDAVGRWLVRKPHGDVTNFYESYPGCYRFVVRSTMQRRTDIERWMGHGAMAHLIGDEYELRLVQETLVESFANWTMEDKAR